MHDEQTVTAIIPLKALSAAKGRLAGHLDDAARRELVAWMFAQVVCACRDARRVDDILVIAGDTAAGDLARDHGVRVLRERTPGLNAALATATAAVAGAGASLVVAADLPLARGADLDRVCAGDHGDGRGAVTVVPTRDGGTAALLRRPVAVIPTAYGAGSAAAHLALARDAGVAARRLAIASLALDVDTPGHLREAQAQGARTPFPMAHTLPPR